MAEQLVGAVDEVDLHDGPESVTARHPARRPPGPGPEGAFGLVVGVRRGRVVGGDRLGQTAEASEQVGPHGVKEVVRLEGQFVDSRQAGRGPLDLTERDGAVTAPPPVTGRTESWS